MMEFKDQIQLKINKARKEHDAEATTYYEERQFSCSACADFETFRGSWAYEPWVKENSERINNLRKFWRRCGYYVK